MIKKLLSIVAVVALFAMCSPQAPDTPGDNGTPSSGSGSGSGSGSDPSDLAQISLEIDGAEFIIGPSYFYLTVNARNTGTVDLKADLSVEYSENSNMSAAKTANFGTLEAPAGKTVKQELQITGLKEKFTYYLRAFVSIGGKTYKSEIISRETAGMYFYLPDGVKSEYSFGEEGGSFNLTFLTNIDFTSTSSAGWLTVKNETHEYHRQLNTYELTVAANTSSESRTATFVFENTEYKQNKTITVTQSGMSPASGETDGHAWVNLGLPSGTLWATMNVGASKPEEYGRYVAWGETVTFGEEDKDNAYNFENYKSYVKNIFNGDSYKFFYDEGIEHSLISKYNSKDGLTELVAADDAVIAQWGSKWTTPTYNQIDELTRNTKYEWVENYKGTGVAGGIYYRKKASGSYTLEDSHIFIPASGEAEYLECKYQGSWGSIWSKSMVSVSAASNKYYDVWSLNIVQNGTEPSATSRIFGHTIRPVVAK